jgi:hypothetical protein
MASPEGINQLIILVSKHSIIAGGSKSPTLALYLFKQHTPGGSMHPFSKKNKTIYRSSRRRK